MEPGWVISLPGPGPAGVSPLKGHFTLSVPANAPNKHIYHSDLCHIMQRGIASRGALSRLWLQDHNLIIMILQNIISLRLEAAPQDQTPSSGQNPASNCDPPLKIYFNQ